MHDDPTDYGAEDDAAQRALYGNDAARRIIDDLLERWPEFSSSPLTVELRNKIYSEILGGVVSLIDEELPSEQVKAHAKKFFKAAILRNT